ncbi:MAG: hypothetical protein WCX64_04480 [Candidatus Micrarchaeia archaeon]|jgi:hypothetical protein
MVSAGSRIGKIASNKLLISAVFAVGIIAALFYSVPAYAFTIANGVAANVNGTTTITYNATIYKVTDEAIGNVSAKLWHTSTIGSTPGKDYVYATSCTPSYYAAPDGYSTSGYSPNGYGFTDIGNLGYGYNADTAGYEYFYGTGYGYGYTADASAPLFCIFEFKNLDYGVPYTNATIYINDVQVQILALNPAIYIFDYPTLFSSIKTSLATHNVTTNIDECGATATACTGLYFNATTASNGSIGANVTFTGTLDLTSSSTVAFLQSFGSNMQASQGMVQINATNSAAFAAAGTQITLFGLPNYGAVLPSLTVTYDNGTISTSPSEVTGLTYTNTTGVLVFSASHLSKYDVNVPRLANESSFTLTSVNSEVVMNGASPNFTVAIPSNAVSAVLNATAFMWTNGTVAATIPTSVGATSTSSLLSGTVNVTFPASIIVYGPAGWNGQINLPIVKPTSVATVNPDSGYTTTTYAVIDVGYGDEQLNFSKAVRIVIPGMKDKLAAFKRGSTVTTITTNCTGDTQTDGNSLGAGMECKINSGNDLVIWTKHFTQFIAYTQNLTTSSGSTTYTYTYTTATPTPSAQPSTTATVTPTPTTAMPSPSPIASPTETTTSTATPTSTVSATPTTPANGTTGGDNTLWIIAIVVVIIGAGAYFFLQKKQ